MLNLTRKDLAAKEDLESHLHLWASFFKATTWEELQMLAKQDEFINEASATIYQLSQEEQVRLQCEAREDYYRRQRTIQHNLDRQKDTIKSQNATIENQNSMIKQLTDDNISQKEKIISLQEELASLRREITSLTQLLSDSFR